MNEGARKEHTKQWMLVSGATGLSAFLIANFTDIFAGSSVLAGIVQLAANAFVFVVWSRAFVVSDGLQKVVAGIGAAVPVAMALITLVRVLLPASGM